MRGIADIIQPLADPLETGFTRLPVNADPDTDFLCHSTRMLSIALGVIAVLIPFTLMWSAHPAIALLWVAFVIASIASQALKKILWP